MQTWRHPFDRKRFRALSAPENAPGVFRSASCVLPVPSTLTCTESATRTILPMFPSYNASPFVEKPVSMPHSFARCKTSMRSARKSGSPPVTRNRFTPRSARSLTIPDITSVDSSSPAGSRPSNAPQWMHAMVQSKVHSHITVFGGGVFPHLRIVLKPVVRALTCNLLKKELFITFLY